MNLTERYKDKLNSKDRTGGYFHLDSKNRNIIFKNIHLLEFDDFYIRIAIDLFENGYLPNSEKNNINKLKDYIEDKSKDSVKFENENWQSPKTWGEGYHPRYYFSYLQLSYEGNHYFYLITTYSNCLMSELVDNNDVIYADTDCIYYRGDIKSELIRNLKYKIYKIDYFSPIHNKRYVIYSHINESELPKYLTRNTTKDGFIIKGYSNISKAMANIKLPDLINCIESIKSELREDKISQILS